MFIAVSNNDAIQLYEQMEKQIITQIVSGTQIIWWLQQG